MFQRYGSYVYLSLQIFRIEYIKAFYFQVEGAFEKKIKFNFILIFFLYDRFKKIRAYN